MLWLKAIIRGSAGLLACLFAIVSTYGLFLPLEASHYAYRPLLMVQNNQRPLRPYEPIVILSSTPLTSGSLHVQGMQGYSEVSEHKIIFYPSRCYPFNSLVDLRVQADTADGQKLTHIFSLTTADYSERLWIEAAEGERPQKVRIWQGQELVKEFIASMGTANAQTPGGIFRVQDRGQSFWSEKYQEGAYYWVRLKGNYLFHSVPFGRDHVLKQEAKEKLGSPASHGCIRLSLEDAKWVYDHVPSGIYVIIRKEKHSDAEGKPAFSHHQKLVVAMATDPIRLDPHDTSDNPSAIVNSHIFDTLLELDADGKINPALAVNIDSATSLDQWVVTLREGVYFQDGTPLTAKIVQESFHRLLDPELKLARRGLFGQFIRKVQVIDAHRALFELHHPLSSFPYLLTHSSTAIVKAGPSGKLVGTGPYLLARWEPGYELILRAGGTSWRGRPFFSEICFRTVPESSARSVLLETGMADVAFPLSPLDVAHLRKVDGITVLAEPSHRIIYIGLNLTQPYLQSQKVRQALNYAVNKQALVHSVLFGLGDITGSPLAPSVNGYTSIEPFPYKPDLARKILTDSGLAGRKISLWVPKGRYLQDSKIGEAVAGYLREAGLQVELKLWEWSTYMGILDRNKADWDLFLLGWVPATGDAQMGLDPLFQADSPSNLTFFQDPIIEDLLRQAVLTKAETRQHQLYGQVQQAIHERAPWIFLYAQAQTVGIRTDLQGVTVLPTEVVAFHRAQRGAP